MGKVGRGQRGSEETKFLRGQLGVDGAAIEAEADAGRGADKDALLRQRAYLGRELFTWLLYRSERGEPISELDGEGISVLLVGRTILRGIVGDASEIAAKGQMSAYASVVKKALVEGLLVHQTRLRIQLGEHVFEATVDAERFAFRSAELPELLAEEEEERVTERLYLAEKLVAAFDALWEAFMALRTSADWNKKEVPAILEWLASSDEVKA
ncbi:MAG: hypothetical protein HYV07_03280 [Deltaproteobacteria bacterium]|nr:hypothetical protein [Deltaproteobacteria bacterium]